MPLIDKLAQISGIHLPSDHRAALCESNGAEIYGGYLRLFGVGVDENIDSIKWNDLDCWKFAWEDRCSGYWCFAETAWGDQYAYEISALNNHVSKIYLLDCLSMMPTLVASSFSEFLENEFIRSAREPYDVMMKQARQILGYIHVEEHLIYVPSPLLGGSEDIVNVRKMDARSAMICNGDIATQLDVGPAHGRVRAVTPYQDSAHRMRLRLSWA